MGKSAKGGEYERQICRELSAWWTGGRRSDVFWRVPGSGGRATVRGRRGQQTYGQYGDIEATHAKARPFLRMFTTELKRGYTKFSPFDLIDRGHHMAVQQFEGWVIQAMEGAEYAKSQSWMIISRRDQRRSVVTVPKRFLHLLARIDAPSANNLWAITPQVQWTVSIRKTKQASLSAELITIPFDEFFRALLPRDVLAVLEFCRGRGA